MPVSIGEVLILLLIGGLAGSLVGILATRSKRGYGWFWNVTLGVVGSLVGGLLCWLFRIDLGLGEITITYDELITAVLGSALVLAVVWGVQTKKRKLYWFATSGAAVAVIVLLAFYSRLWR